MPVALFKGDKFSSSETSNRLSTSTALLGKQISIAVGTIRLVVLRRKLLLRQLLVAVSARETLPVPWHVLVGHTSFIDHPTTLRTFLCKIAFIAWDTDNLLFTWDEAFVSDWFFADHTGEAFLMPLLTLVLKFLHSSSEGFSAPITPSSKVVVVAISAEDLVILWGKRLIDQCLLTFYTLETELMPVMVFVGQILIIWTNRFFAFLTVVGKKFLIAWYTVGMFFL